MDASDFWSATDYLKHIKQFAHSRRVAPYAVLGAAIALRLAELPPNHQLPALIGAEASLNFFVGLAAESGGGKTTAIAAAKALLWERQDGNGRWPVDIREPGSGENFSHLFKTHEGKGEPVWVRRCVVAKWDEISTLAATAARSGSTLVPKLCSAFMGEELGASHVDKMKTLPLGEHSYRFNAVAGVQLSRSDVLFKEAAVGLPQRFLFVPAVDPEMPEERPADPGPLLLVRDLDARSDDPSTLRATELVPVCAKARADVDAEQLRTVRGHGGDELDAHALLVQLKVAAGLSLLEADRAVPEVSELTWELAGHLLEVSRETRRTMKDRLTANRRAEDREAGEREAERGVARRNAEANAERLCDWARRKLRERKDAGESTTKSALRCLAPGRDRDDAGSAIERLLDSGVFVLNGKHLDFASDMSLTTPSEC